MHCKCFRELDLDDNQIGELGGFEVMRALTKREQRTCHSAELSHNTTQLTHADRAWQLRANFVSDASQVEVGHFRAKFFEFELHLQADSFIVKVRQCNKKVSYSNVSADGLQPLSGLSSGFEPQYI